MVTAEDVISIYKRLTKNGVQVWITGGWGIDALLGEETRPHKDLDVIILLDNVAQTCELMARDGFSLKDLWSENRWRFDAHQSKAATAFVLQDTAGREFDAHAMCLDDQGNGVPAWEEAEGFVFNEKDLSGIGKIAGLTVQCIAPEMQMRCHMGYELPEKQLRDLELLHEKFGVQVPR